MNIKRKIFEHLIDAAAQWGRLPGQPEVCQAFAGLCDDVPLHLEQLAREGLIRLGPVDQPDITLVPTYQPPLEIPWRDQARTGANNHGVQPHGFIRLDIGGMELPPAGELVALHVPDDMMIDAGIRCGDLAIIKATPPKKGEVAVFESEGRTCFRRFLILSGIPHLLAENARSPELLPAWDITFQGVLWGLVRLEAPANPQNAPKPVINYPAQAGSPLLSKANRRLNQDGPDHGRRFCPRPLRAGRNIDRFEKKSGGLPEESKKKVSLKLGKPPRRLGLNEKERSAYKPAKERLIIDERPEATYAGPRCPAPKEAGKRNRSTKR